MIFFQNLWRYVRQLFHKTPTEWDTDGPPPDEEPVVTVKDVMEVKGALLGSAPWEFGWWLDAHKVPAHPMRIGGPIVPRAIVVHTTDTYPGGFTAIAKAWGSEPGKGNAAHFMIGRTAQDGVVQFAPVTRNANHAGGKPHGNWKTAAGVLIHPNTIAVGIELDCAGQLKIAKDGAIYHPDSGKSIPVSDVYFDAKGRPWHKVTDYQLYTLRKLIDDLRLALKPTQDPVAPDGNYAQNGVAYYASAPLPWLVGHVTLDPVNRTDPGPQVMEWLRAQAWSPL